MTPDTKPANPQNPQGSAKPRQLACAIRVKLTDELFARLARLSKYGGGGKIEEVASRGLERLQPVQNILFREAMPQADVAFRAVRLPSIEPHPRVIKVIVTRATCQWLSALAKASHLKVEEVAALVLLEMPIEVVAKSRQAALEFEAHRAKHLSSGLGQESDTPATTLAEAGAVPSSGGKAQTAEPTAASTIGSQGSACA